MLAGQNYAKQCLKAGCCILLLKNTASLSWHSLNKLSNVFEQLSVATIRQVPDKACADKDRNYGTEFEIHAQDLGPKVRESGEMVGHALVEIHGFGEAPANFELSSKQCLVWAEYLGCTHRPQH